MIKKFNLIILVFFILVTVSACGCKKDEKQTEENYQINQNINLEEEINPAVVSNSDHVLGAEGAPVTIIIYSNFDCLFCADLAGAEGSIKKALIEFGDKIRIVFRHFYLSSQGKASLAAQAAECAGEQENFWQMHDKLFLAHKENKASAEQIKFDAQEIGVDIKKFSECLDSEKYKEKVLADLRAAEAMGISSTPTMFVNNKIITGNIKYEDYEDDYGKQEGLKSIIAGELSRVKN